MESTQKVRQGLFSSFFKNDPLFRFLVFGGSFFSWFFDFLNFQNNFLKSTLKVGGGIFYSNLSYDPLFRLLVFLGGLFGFFWIFF